MNVNLLDGFEYEPTFNGNLEAPEGERIIVKFRFPSMGEIRKIATIKDSYEKQKADFLCFVESIKNCKVNGKELSVEEVYEQRGLASLCTELISTFVTSSAVDKKK